MKLIGSIAAISAIELLRIFMTTGSLTGEQVGWKLATHITLVMSGLLFALMDRIAQGTEPAESAPRGESH
jgi:uncharacterized protein (TIGR00645 family)